MHIHKTEYERNIPYTRDTSYIVTCKRCSVYAYRQNHRIKEIYKAYIRGGGVRYKGYKA